MKHIYDQYLNKMGRKVLLAKRKRERTIGETSSSDSQRHRR